MNTPVGEGQLGIKEAILEVGDFKEAKRQERARSEEVLSEWHTHHSLSHSYSVDQPLPSGWTWSGACHCRPLRPAFQTSRGSNCPRQAPGCWWGEQQPLSLSQDEMLQRRKDDGQRCGPNLPWGWSQKREQAPPPCFCTWGQVPQSPNRSFPRDGRWEMGTQPLLPCCFFGFLLF